MKAECGASENPGGKPRFPQSIAIAGAWGYIGRKFLDAALALGLRTYVYDPGPAPADLAAERAIRIAAEESFYQLQADLFHLALHPEHRRRGLAILLERSRAEPIVILCEKPMAAPEHPEECGRIIDAADRARAVVLYDFPELYDPLTRRIREHLARFRDVRIESIHLQRSKDREDPAQRRNYKRMVTIQYQESVHCLAFALYTLAGLRGGDPEALFADGLSVAAASEPYCPPNPEAYPRVVDGRCEFRLALAGATIEGRTDFKRGAPWAKRRILRGTADGRPFVIEVDYLEGCKRLTIDGEEQAIDPAADSYAAVIETLGDWRAAASARELMTGLYPNPRFARLTYQLSSALWRSSRERKPIALASLEALQCFDAGFAAAIR